MDDVKRRLRVLEPRLHQVMEVTIPHDMDRLQSQRCAIEQILREGDWEALLKEQRNATLTIKVTSNTRSSFPLL